MVSSSATSTPVNRKTLTSRTPSPNQEKPRPPLLPSDSANSKCGNALPRRPMSREVPSRLFTTPSLSSSTSSTSKRCASPVISRSEKVSTARTIPSPSSAVKRSQSAERRRPTTSSRGGAVSNAQKMLITASRSLSVSFQGESFSLQVTSVKKKSAIPSSSSPSTIGARKPVALERGKTTPGRSSGGSDHADNSKPAVTEPQQRWPGRIRQKFTQNSMLSRSVDLTIDRNAGGQSGIKPSTIRPLHSQFSLPAYGSKLNTESARCDHPISSDAESTSSASSGSIRGGILQRDIRGIVVPSRFLNGSEIKLRSPPELPTSPGSRTPISKPTTSKTLGIDNSTSSPVSRTPVRSRPASPSKFSSGTILSPIRGVSPSRGRNSLLELGTVSLTKSSDCIPSIMSYDRGGKVADKVVEIHLLRILFNRLLQWRFVNARADTALRAQRSDAQKNLYVAHKTTSNLLESVKVKRIKLQNMRQNLKLMSILKEQMSFLNQLEHIEKEFSHSLTVAVEALRASTLRLPVVGAARADLQNVNDAIISAVDVMQAMGSSICMLLTKVGEANTGVAELARVAAKERSSLDHCLRLLSAAASLQVNKFSVFSVGWWLTPVFLR